MVTRFYGIKTGTRKVSVPNLVGISKNTARINLSNLGLTYLEQTTPGNTLADNDVVSVQNIESNKVVPMGTVIQYTYKVFTFTPPYFPPFFPPFFPPHFPPFFPPYFPPAGCNPPVGSDCEVTYPETSANCAGCGGPCYRFGKINSACGCSASSGLYC